MSQYSVQKYICRKTVPFIKYVFNANNYLLCANKVGWLVVFRIYIASAVFQPYRDLEAGDNQSLNRARN